ncbi:DUF2283 domain-containing protein [Leifsonia sp. NPDC058292]|uniref:DUF2283 domain-containing protein n=1 Tax=Leifsonia sp. NPDC058292 TaxID=3346428 RepID=UPI0036DBF8A4
MRLTYDPELDVAHLRFDTGTDPLSAERSPGGTPFAGSYVDLEYDADGHLIGIEVLGARQILRPEVLAAAERISPRGRGSAGTAG